MMLKITIPVLYYGFPHRLAGCRGEDKNVLLEALSTTEPDVAGTHAPYARVMDTAHRSTTGVSYSLY